MGPFPSPASLVHVPSSLLSANVTGTSVGSRTSGPPRKSNAVTRLWSALTVLKLNPRSPGASSGESGDPRGAPAETTLLDSRPGPARRCRTMHTSSCRCSALRTTPASCRRCPCFAERSWGHRQHCRRREDATLLGRKKLRQHRDVVDVTDLFKNQIAHGRQNCAAAPVLYPRTSRQS